MTDWSKPQIVDRITQAFPADVSGLIPPLIDIPAVFKDWPGTPWNEWQRRWFYQGLPHPLPTPRDGIDLDTAMGHLRAIQGSFQPRHEHKEAAVAYLASLWFKPCPLPDTGASP